MNLTLSPVLGQHFAYTLGRLGALENTLLTQSDIDRLLGAHSGEEAVKMLRDIEFLPPPESNELWTQTLDRGMKNIKEQVERSVPEEKQFIFDIFWLEGDRVRIAYAHKKNQKFVSPSSSTPAPALTSGFEPELQGPLDSPQHIDDSVAQACERQALHLAKRSNSALIQSYVQHTINAERSRSAMRSAQHDIETIVFEKEIVASLRGLLSEMRNQMLGPEALFAYCVRALNHIAVLRVLLTGKLNNLEIQKIKSLLPPQL